MDTHAIAMAAQQLYRLESLRQKGPRLSADLRPHTPADGWQIQRHVSALRESMQGRPVAGWKCALPQADCWVVAAMHTALTATTEQTVPACVIAAAPAGPKGTPRIEPELAFRLKHDLPPRRAPYFPADVDAAVGSVHIAVEVLGCRYDEPERASGPELMADSLWHQTLVLGPALQLSPDQTGFSIRLDSPDRKPVVLPARHPNVNPRLPLYWLAEFLRAQGVGLQGGQAVITGSLAGVLELPFGRALQLHFGDLGSLGLSLTELRPAVQEAAATL